MRRVPTPVLTSSTSTQKKISAVIASAFVAITWASSVERATPRDFSPPIAASICAGSGADVSDSGRCETPGDSASNGLEVVSFCYITPVKTPADLILGSLRQLLHDPRKHVIERFDVHPSFQQVRQGRPEGHLPWLDLAKGTTGGTNEMRA